ncbi:hypothetical protein FACS1894101_3810 [Betaproteobacteria bacterium]|nr:hypothetical protein FACS1894101_3810 [Betaproteobacteria bacterium]
MIKKICAALAIVALAVLILALVALAPLWYELPALDNLDGMEMCTAENPGCSQVKVKIEHVPTLLKQAIIAAEDEHFYAHRWSMITAQVARHLLTVERRQPQRHMRDVLLIFKLELYLGKDQILEFYINNTFLGHGAYGFEAATQTYFGKSLTRLTLAETAMLAGLPRSPSSFNPIDNLPRAKERQKRGLERMLKAGVRGSAGHQGAADAGLIIGNQTSEVWFHGERGIEF